MNCCLFYARWWMFRKIILKGILYIETFFCPSHSHAGRLTMWVFWHKKKSPETTEPQHFCVLKQNPLVLQMYSGKSTLSFSSSFFLPVPESSSAFYSVVLFTWEPSVQWYDSRSSRIFSIVRKGGCETHWCVPFSVCTRHECWSSVEKKMKCLKKRALDEEYVCHLEMQPSWTPRAWVLRQSWCLVAEESLWPRLEVQ